MASQNNSYQGNRVTNNFSDSDLLIKIRLPLTESRMLLKTNLVPSRKQRSSVLCGEHVPQAATETTNLSLNTNFDLHPSLEM